MHSGLAGARVDQVIGADANDYITKLENAHGTEFGELLYPWHPWAGLRIDLHESVSKPDGVVLLDTYALIVCFLVLRSLVTPSCASLRARSLFSGLAAGSGRRLGSTTTRPAGGRPHRAI
jgi:hypothetical protein